MVSAYWGVNIWNLKFFLITSKLALLTLSFPFGSLVHQYLWLASLSFLPLMVIRTISFWHLRWILFILKLHSCLISSALNGGVRVNAGFSSHCSSFFFLSLNFLLPHSSDCGPNFCLLLAASADWCSTDRDTAGFLSVGSSFTPAPLLLNPSL